MNIEERNKLYKQYDGIVAYILKGWTFKTRELEEDCFQEARCILLKAIENYSKCKNKVSIMNYLYRSVKWGMLRQYPRIKDVIQAPTEIGSNSKYKRLFTKYGGIPPADIIRKYKLKDWIFNYLEVKSENGIVREYNAKRDIRTSRNEIENIDRNLYVKSIVKKVGRTLSKREFTVLKEKYLNNDSKLNRDIAKKLGITEKNLRDIINRLLRKIRKQVRKDEVHYAV